MYPQPKDTPRFTLARVATRDLERSVVELCVAAWRVVMRNGDDLQDELEEKLQQFMEDPQDET